MGLRPDCTCRNASPRFRCSQAPLWMAFHEASDPPPPRKPSSAKHARCVTSHASRAATGHFPAAAGGRARRAGQCAMPAGSDPPTRGAGRASPRRRVTTGRKSTPPCMTRVAASHERYGMSPPLLGIPRWGAHTGFPAPTRVCPRRGGLRGGRPLCSPLPLVPSARPSCPAPSTRPVMPGPFCPAPRTRAPRHRATSPAARPPFSSAWGRPTATSVAAAAACGACQARGGNAAVR